MIRTVSKWLLYLVRCLPAEFSHHLTLRLIQYFYPRRRVKSPQLSTTFAGLALPNPVGLAAGLDKNGRCIDAWFAMGFGFVEVGTVTPRPQAGNPKPRLFRLMQSRALINRMGFNNDGVDALVERLKRRKLPGVLGVNIGKNKETANEHAARDYLICLEKVYPYADYITVNISSPNTPGLRDLQSVSVLNDLLSALSESRAQLTQRHKKQLPIFVKIAPDLTVAHLHQMLTCIVSHGMDGVIACNTTVSRVPVKGQQYANEQGGLSGRPIYSESFDIFSSCVEFLQGRLPVIAVGGIDSASRARAVMARGAAGLQIYTGFTYQGPELIQKIHAELLASHTV